MKRSRLLLNIDVKESLIIQVLTFQQQHVVLLVVSTFRVLPIYVQAVEVPVAKVRDCGVDERLARVASCCHILELLGSEGPTTWGGMLF